MRNEEEVNATNVAPPHLHRNRANSVLQRRKYHIAITEWEVRWLPWLHLLGTLIGIGVVLMPSISKFWLVAIERINILQFLHAQFSNLGWLVMAALILYAMTHAISAIMSKHIYPGWDAQKEWGLPNAKQIIQRGLYPHTKKQEFVFLVCAFQSLLSPLLVVVLFGVLAFFIRLARS